jgi:hypothetical protein
MVCHRQVHRDRAHRRPILRQRVNPTGATAAVNVPQRRRGWRYSTCPRPGWRAGTAPLPARGYSRDGKKGKPQIEYGLLTDPVGRPVAVRVFPADTADPAAFTEAVTACGRSSGCPTWSWSVTAA